MDLEKTGKFIAQLRKEKGMTQKELGAVLNITDKAISKWERGYNLPDSDVMVRLCNVLGISINELISGERISSENYNTKAEENIMNLVNENEWKRTRGWGVYLFPIVAIVLLGFMFHIYVNQESYWGQYVNIPALIFIVVGTTLLQLITGTFADFWSMYKLFHSDKVESQKICKAVGRTITYVLCTSSSYSFLQIIDVFKTSELEYIATNLGSAICPLLYGAVYVLCFLPILFLAQDKAS